jgi:hypothetical protein
MARSMITLPDGSVFHGKSEAECWFALELARLEQAKAIGPWRYEPESFTLDYKYHRCECRDTYTPDFVTRWDGDSFDTYYEVKRGWGAEGQKYSAKIKRFCQQYPDVRLVLVWYGSLPKKGKGARYTEKVQPWVHHIWTLKPPRRKAK